MGNITHNKTSHVTHMAINSLLSAGICMLIDDYMNIKARRDDALSEFS